MTSTAPPEFAGGARVVGGAESSAERLRSMIADGVLLPGTQLSEERLSDNLRVSRNTLREAFRLLSHERLVEHRFNRGVFVSRVSPADVRDVFTTRRVLQFAAIRACATDDAALEEAEAAIDLARRAAGTGDWATVGSANIHFHRALVSVLSSDRVGTLMGALLAEIRLAFHAVDDPAAFHGPYIDRNAELVATLRRGDRSAAERQLASYLDDAEAELVRAAGAMS